MIIFDPKLGSGLANDWSNPVAFGNPELSSPIAGVSTALILKQKYMQQAANFVPLALNTPHPTVANFYLTAESERQDIGGGVVQWIRTYCAVPPTRFEGSSIAYTFPGLQSVATVNGSNVNYTLRDPLPLVVPCTVEYDYFLTDGTMAGLSAIPVNQKLRFVQTLTNVGIAVGLYDVLFLFDALWFNGVQYPGSQYTTTGVPPGVGLGTSEYLTNANSWVNEKQQIVAEDSTLTRWQGNIYQRVTKYVTAR